MDKDGEWKPNDYGNEVKQASNHWSVNDHSVALTEKIYAGLRSFLALTQTRFYYATTG